jgi:hypothetical protein
VNPRCRLSLEAVSEVPPLAAPFADSLTAGAVLYPDQPVVSVESQGWPANGRGTAQ